MPARTPWSRMRFWSLITAIACGLLVGGTYGSSHIYTGDFQGGAEFWLLVFSGTVAAVAFIGACVRDGILAGQRELKQTLEDLPLHIVDYGDRREVAGHQLATRVGANQRRGGLSTVE